MAVEVSQGVCDLCGAPSDASLQECNWLTCTFQHCEGGLYHQECLEKYLKSNKLEKNRKTGFKCPRGCGKGTRFDQACPGRIDKSHPIHPRNEDKKKTKLAAVVVEPQRPAKPAAPPVPNGKAAKGKEETCAGKDSKSTPAAKPAPAAKAAAPAAAAAPQAAVAKAGKKETPALPPRPEVVEKKKLAELAAQARREIGLPAASTSGLASHGSKGDLQGLATGAAGPSKPVAPATASAWGKPSIPTPEPPAVSPQPAMMSQLPQLQQLLQQAVGKKAASKAATGAAVSVSAQAPKPAPAVPQPVLNPPTPVWPALGTALFSSGSTSSAGLTPRESAPRPPSPPSAWGSATSTPAAAQPQVSQQQQQPQAPASASSKVSAPAAGASATAPTAALAPSTSAPAAAGTSGSGASGSADAASSSERGSTSDMQQLASNASAPAGASAATASGSGVGTAPRSGSQLVGAEFADEEGKEQKLTKAQKKNLKRTEKKKAPSASSLDHQQADPGQEAAEAASRDSMDGAGTPSQQGGGAAPASGRAASRGAAASGGGAGSSSGNAAGAGSGVHRRQASRGSDDPEQAHVAEAEEAAVMEELCINCIVARKVLSLITQLQRLGALEFVAAAAVQRHGSNLLAALEWLLVAGADAATKTSEVVLTAAAESASAAESEIDITDELQQLSDLQAAMGVPTELLQQCVLDCNGDVQTAANTAVERMLAAPSASGASLGGDMHVGSSGNLQMLAGSGLRGGSSSVQLRTSSSFYSVSSLDGAAASGEPDKQHSQQPHQPSSSSHFGVRLQDEEPVGAGGSSSYSTGPGSYAAGLLRGGVVLGAAGWQNGYLREPPATGLAAASAVGGGGRSTSRLLHWLGDDAGRTAALAEEPALGRDAASAGAGPSGSLLGAADPVLVSPFSGHGDVQRGLGAPKAAGDSPSLHTWLGSNGYHPPGIGAPGHSTAAASAGSVAAGGQYELHCSAGSNGNFSFMSAIGKASFLASAAAAQSRSVEQYSGYGTRWAAGGLMAPGAAAQHFGGAAGVSSEQEPTPHSDGDNDLSSIMALINVR